MFSSDLFLNKTVIVTGGRSGIGFSISKLFLRLGAKVIIASRTESLVTKAVKSLSSFGKAFGYQCDIRDLESVNKFSDWIKNKFKTVDVLVNNAGGQFPSTVTKMSVKGWNAVINNNLNGTFNMCHVFGNNFFIPQQKGSIVNITANISRGFPGMAHTGAARAGVENLTKSLAQEWAEYKIRVNTVAPGTIATTGLESYPDEMQKFLKASEEKNLTKRFGTPQDVAFAVAFLASPLSSYISGVTLPVDGLENLAGDRMELYNVLKKF
tara:strand:+ start:744 stop:1544 length:801 start_codon:yes stop_codon:yes gene_type:complete